MREMRAISFVTKLIDDGALDDSKARRMLIHAIAADEVMSKLGVASKLNADWDFLMYLHETGRKSADAWLGANFDRLNVESTVDIRDRYL
jgi:NTE family protein